MFQGPLFKNFYFLMFYIAGSSSAIGMQDSTAHLLVSDPNLIHVLVKFLSGTSPHGTNQHSPQVSWLQKPVIGPCYPINMFVKKNFNVPKYVKLLLPQY